MKLWRRFVDADLAERGAEQIFLPTERVIDQLNGWSKKVM
jgi:hypothetical protein